MSEIKSNFVKIFTMELTHRTCSICKIEKEITDFTKDKHDKSGYTYSCKECRRAKEKVWRDENKDKVREINKKSRERRKDYYQSERGIESSRRTHLKRKYNMTLEEYNELSESQNHVCQICGKPETSIRNNFLCVDHCHDTGRVRGLLCNSCNRGLGLFVENTEFLKNAINYLNKYKNESTVIN